ncbi:MAG: Fe-S cluster assembly protein SufB [Candidatus Margulisiibacteriota bacterium]|jgi:Fe-S cluster assembly protein SufB
MKKQQLENLANQEYKYGFKTNIKTKIAPKGLNQDTITLISKNKNEPQFMLDFRLKAFEHFKSMQEPCWPELKYQTIDFQDIHYYSAPKSTKKFKNLNEIDSKLKSTFDKLGVPLLEQKQFSGVAVDAIFDSVSVATTYKQKLLDQGIIFCPISEAVEKYPELIKQYLGTIVPYTDNFYAALNSAVFTDGSFVFIPKNKVCPIDLSSYFRINTAKTGQFERTLIIAEEGSSVNYLEGCTAPMFDTNQLHAAVVELIALDHASINYSTVQNWYPGNPKTGKGGIYNFVTKRGLCQGKNSKISWTQVETGSAITWKYPSCVLLGDNSSGEFYSVALTNHFQQADTGTKMIHLGKNTKSTILSKGISLGKSVNSYRGLVKIAKSADNAKNYTSCDSLLIGPNSKANTFPTISAQNNTCQVEHEASASKISEDQLFYFQQRGIDPELAISTIVNGFCHSILKKLPSEFAVEAVRLLNLKLEEKVA